MQIEKVSTLKFLLKIKNFKVLKKIDASFLNLHTAHCQRSTLFRKKLILCKTIECLSMSLVTYKLFLFVLFRVVSGPFQSVLWLDPGGFIFYERRLYRML